MRLEDLHLLSCDHRAAHAANELLALAAEHHAGDDLDPPATRTVEHSVVLLVAGPRPVTFHVAANAPRATIGAVSTIPWSPLAALGSRAARSTRTSIPSIRSIPSSFAALV